MRNRLLTNWTLWRFSRLAFALVFIVAGIIRYDMILSLGGVFLLFHSLLNTCAACENGACEVPKQTKNG